jgi:PEP-CTERM motif-containing protein
LGLAVAGARAQSAITSVTTDIISGSPTTVTANSETVTFDNDQDEVVSFTTATTTYYATATAQEAIIDRDPTNDTYAPNQLSLWYAYTGSATDPTYEGTYQTNANTALLGNNLYEGSDNLFVNDNGNTQSSGDVERLDFVLSKSGESATTGQAFAVFDRGNDTNHDSFKIAVITAVDSNGNPTAYGGDLITVTPDDYDTSANPVANQNYTVFRYKTGDNISAWDNNVTGGSIASTDQGTQGVGGTVLSLANLGISAGTTIYGYSITASDVYSTSTASVAINAAISADLVNYMNTTYYPNDSSDNTSTGNDSDYGGIDLMDVNGVEFSTTKPIPEPATYGMIFAGLGVLTVAIFRPRRKAGVTLPAA